jgi:beta-glucanase (GH16 family)
MISKLFKKLSFLVVLVLCSTHMACSSNSDSAPDSAENPTPDPVEVPKPKIETNESPVISNPNEWELDTNLSDEFSGNSINNSKWNNNPSDWGPWSWEPDNAYQKDNNLSIRMRYEEHARGVYTKLFYKSGIIRSLDTITYGYVEAKIKGIHTFPGASPAFWLYSIGRELDGWNLRENTEGAIRYSEVDVVEMLQSNWTQGHGWDGPEVIDCNLHTVVIENGKELWKRPGGYPELTKNVYNAPWDPREDYHTYGAEIAKNKVTWYIDGKKIAEKNNLYWHLPMHVTLSLGLRQPHVTYNNCPDGIDRCPVESEATATGFPTEMKVDWVRCYRKK